MVWLYAPSGAPETWAQKGWRIETERGGIDNGPIRERVKASSAMEAYNSPGLIWKAMLFRHN